MNLFTGRELLSSKKSKTAKKEIEDVTKIFGKLPRSIYFNCEDPLGIMKKFTVDEADVAKHVRHTRKILEKKIQNQHRSVIDQEEFLEFLFNMVHIVPGEMDEDLVPSKRMNAEELLAHPWLRDVAE